ncbi:MAG TPA: 4-hydroxybutyrate dehydrogenase, partial [Kiloniellales bacterium]|nr:4-hydroxybutyrate dehydrogenase [Kiloniellales bacterium]
MHIINYLTTIAFGAGAIQSLPAALEELKVTRPLLVSDHGVKAAGLLDVPGAEVLQSAPAYLEVQTNP